MNGIAKSMAVIGTLSASLALSGCAAKPSHDRARGDVYETDEVNKDTIVERGVVDNAGLGVVNSGGQTTVQCRKKRRTGSNISRSSCADRNESGTQPVREGLDAPGVNVSTNSGRTPPD